MNQRRHLRTLSLSSAACLLCSALIAASPAGAQLLLNETSAQFSWQPAVGEVEFYEVWVSRSTRGGGFAMEQTVSGTATSAVVDAEVGEILRVRVRAGNDKAFGPMSPASQQVRFGLPPEYPVVGMAGVVSGRAGGVETASVYFADETTGATWRYSKAEPEQTPTQIGQEPDDRWKLVASADFDGDGTEDLFWHHENGATRIWYLDGDTHQEEATGDSPGAHWVAELTSDFDGNGQDDVFWRDPAGPSVAWLRTGAQFGPSYFPPMPASAWDLLAAGDFDGDGSSDLFWRDRELTDTAVWFLEDDGAGGVYARTRPSNERELSWEVAQTVDDDGDGKDDVLWRQIQSHDIVEWWHMDEENVRPEYLVSTP